MGSSTERLIVQVDVNAQAAEKALSGVGNQFKDFGKDLVGLAAGAFAFDAVIGGIKKIVTAASDLEQATGAVESVFKGNASTIEGWAHDTSDAIRLPAAEFEQLATLIGSQLKGAGVPMDQLAGKTKELMQTGADLASMFGGTTAEAVEALSSALKGEFDPLERYGVNIKQAEINAKALAIAQGDAGKAASRAVQQQATLALIYEKSADAQGNAARETDTFAAKQEQFNEVMGNLAAEIGGPLLSAFGGLLGMLSSMAPLFGAIGTGLASGLSGLMNLPGPILAIAAAFGILLLAGKPIAGMAAQVVSAFQTMILHGMYAKDAFTNAGGGLKGLGAVAAQAGNSLKSAGSSLLGAFGGPIGIAVTLAITAITFGLMKMVEASARTKAIAESTKGAIDGMANALKGVDPSKISEVGREAAVAALKVQEWGKSSKDLSDYNDRLGVDLSLVVDGMTGVAGASDKVEQAYQDQRKSLNDIIAANTSYGSQGEQVFNQSASAAQENLKILDEMHSSYQGLVGAQDKAIAANQEEAAAIQGTTEAAAVAVPTAEELGSAYDKIAKNIRAAADSTEGGGFLDAMASASDRASRAASILGAELDHLTGRTKLTEEANVDAQRGLQDVAKAFEEAGGAVPTDALTSWNYEQINASKEGQGLYDTLNDQTGAYNNVVAAAFAAGSAQGDFAAGVSQASDAANKQRSAFVDLVAPILGSTEAAEALANQLGILSGEQVNISILADDAQAQAALQQLEAAKIDPKTVMVTADDQATPAVESSISYIDTVTGETRKIQLGADPTSADAVVQAVLADIAARSGVMPVTADPTQANATAAATAAGISATTPTMPIDGNPAPAVSSAAGAAGQISGQTAQITVTALSGPAIDALSRLTSAKYQATVDITANANNANTIARAFVGERRQTIVDVNANINAANSTISALTSAQRSTTIMVQANALQALQVISQVVNGNYKAMIQVDANTTAARNAISAVTNGSYTATINVTANTSAAQAAIAAIPRSVSVSSAAAPASAAAPTMRTSAVGVSGFGAPSAVALAPPNLSKTINVPATIVINVEGGLDSADTIGRRVENVMQRYERRRTGIQIGRPATFGQDPA
jgi:hypothetical protein